MSAILLSLGVAWLYTFLFANFRSHHAFVMILRSVLVIVFSVGLFHMVKWCVAGTLVGSILLCGGSVWFQVWAGDVQPFFMLTSFASSVSSATFAILLYKNEEKPWAERLTGAS